MNWYALIALTYWGGLVVLTIGTLVYHRQS